MFFQNSSINIRRGPAYGHMLTSAIRFAETAYFDGLYNQRRAANFILRILLCDDRFTDPPSIRYSRLNQSNQ